MSDSATSEVQKDNPLSISEILADFFLKKIDMPSHSEDSDHKHKSKKKKSKHKKRKHKKSKHRHGSSSSNSSCKTSDLNTKGIVDDVSNSEEMEIKRLKKIKNLKMQFTSKPPSESIECNIKDKSEQNTSMNVPPVFYGPSLELLFSGVNSNDSNIKSTDSSKVVNEEKETNDCKKDVNLICNSMNNGEKECFTLKPQDTMKLDSVVSKTDTSECDGNNSVCNINNNTPCQVKDNTKVVKDDTINCLNNEAKTLESLNKEQCDIQNDLTSEKDNKIICSSNNKESHIVNNKESSTSKDKENCIDKKKHSRSPLSSKSHSKNNSPKSKHRKHSSRSLSRDYSSRKRKRYSRSHSHEKSRERKRRSHSRSHSRSTNERHRKSHSPHDRYNRRRGRSRSRSYNRHRRRSESKIRRRSKSRHHHRSPSESRHRTRSSRRSVSHSRSKSRSRSRRTSASKGKSRSRSRERKSSHTSTKIDQAKILETARKNVLKMMKSGTLPEGLPVENLKKEQLISIQAGGKSVQELTDFCQRLSQKENDPEDSDNEDKADDETGFIHHPFKVKEPGMIKLNIKNAVQLPIKTHAQKVAETARLSSQFPVSSGNQHKQKELEWVPVVPESSKTETKAVKPSKPMEVVATSTASTSNVESPSEVPIPAIPPPPPPPPVPASFCQPPVEAPQVEVSTPVSAMMAPPMPTLCMPPPLQPTDQPMFYQLPAQPLVQTCIASNEQMLSYPLNSVTSASSSSVFKPPKKLDNISSVVTKRFQALIKLQENPNDPEGLRSLQEAQESIQDWVQSQQVPGLFTGSTDAKVLSVAELCGPYKYHHRNRKDILSQAPPVTEGKGMSLLKKMGWNPGEGLGKNKEGSLEPLVLDIKTDKKGLVSEGENSKKVISSFMKELQGKHPVSALMELCSKRRWKPPLYTCVFDHGPPHKKVFCFKVEVNGVEYQPVNPSTNKKVAKADAAVLCLQSLNVLPKTA